MRGAAISLSQIASRGSPARRMPSTLDAPMREALHERGEELVGKIRAYQELLADARPAEEILRGLTVHEKYGLGEGTHAKPHAYRSRKKEA